MSGPQRDADHMRCQGVIRHLMPPLLTDVAQTLRATRLAAYRSRLRPAHDHRQPPHLRQARNCAPHGIVELAIAPGCLRSGALLDVFGVTDESWRDQAARALHFAASEAPRFVGRAIAALAADHRIAAKAAACTTAGTSARSMASAMSTADARTGVGTLRPRRLARRARHEGRNPTVTHRWGSSLCGAGAGNCPIEPFVTVANLQGWSHQCDASTSRASTGRASRASGSCRRYALPISKAVTPSP
jgi:hypothetical protein